MSDWTSMYDTTGRVFKVIPSTDWFIIKMLGLTDSPPVSETVPPVADTSIDVASSISATVETETVPEEVVATPTTTKTRKGSA